MSDLNIQSAEFDTILQNSLPETPPENIVHEVTPWRKAVKRILVGLALTTFTLNLWNLDYILSTAGMILTLLGFRTLRRENGWFRACYVITAIRTAYKIANLILDATIYRGAIEETTVMRILGAISIGLSIAVLFCFWRGFAAILRKAELPDRAGSAAALFVWYLIALVFALLPIDPLIVIIGFFISYIFILRSLFKLSRKLDETGYNIQTAPVRISDRVVVSVILIPLAVGIACGYLFCNSLPMDWSEQTVYEDTKVEAIQNDLIRLGFPEDVLNDLTEEDILACEGALQVYVEEEDIPFNNGRKEIKTITHGGVVLRNEVSTIYDAYEMHATGVAVKLSDAPERWKLFHHFRWNINPGFYGSENIRIQAAYQLVWWNADGAPSGQVLFDRDGVTYTAPYYELDNTKQAYKAHIFGDQISSNIWATFSLPQKGENQRGYVSYSIVGEKSDINFRHVMDYTHQRNFLQYPVQTATEHLKNGGWNNIAFRTRQHSMTYFASGLETDSDS